MALIDRIKHDGPAEELVWKYESENIKIGGQLIVNQSQEVLFFKGGQAADLFGPGTHTLSTKNLPILGKIVNLPFGGKTPFAVEVWFINKVAKLDYKWGTQTPAPIMDPMFGVPISVGAFGQFGLQVVDSKTFVTQIVGTMPHWESSAVLQYFRDVIINRVKDSIAKFLVKEKISIAAITAYLEDLSKISLERIQEEFARYGLELKKFNITSITIPDEELKKIQKGAFQRLEIEQMGDTRYQMKRSLEVMEAAANNPGAVGTLMGAGIGLGVGAQMAQGFSQMGKNVTTQAQTTPPAAPPQPTTNGLSEIKCPKCSAALPAGGKFCANCGAKIDKASTCPSCGATLSPESKFCSNCGAKTVTNKCPDCGADVSPGSKFCPGCGKAL